MSTEPCEIDFDEATLANPYPAYARLRASEGLVRHRTDGYYLVARYADVREAAMRTDDFSSRMVDVFLRSTGLGPWFESMVRRMGPVDVLAVADAPTHLVHRKLATRHFARDPVARAIERALPRLERRLDRFIADGGGDFAAEIAAPVPVEIALAMLGFPESDARRVKRLADSVIVLLSGVVPREGRLASIAAALELYAYSLSRLERARRRGLSGAPLCDAIVGATREGAIGPREAASIAMQILVAGADSTASMLGSAACMLARSPELAATLRADPSLVPAFIEECLRLESPFQGHFRVVRHATRLGGTRLEAGDRLMLLWASANRDPDAFESPDELNLHRKREGRWPVTFGQGPHLCLGGGLARATGRTVVERLLAKTKTLDLATSRLTHRSSAFVRTLTALPLRASPA